LYLLNEKYGIHSVERDKVQKHDHQFKLMLCTNWCIKPSVSYLGRKVDAWQTRVPCSVVLQLHTCSCLRPPMICLQVIT